MKIIKSITAIVILTACLGQLSRLPLPVSSGDTTLYANDILLAGLVVLYLGHALIIRRSMIIPQPMLLAGLFLAVAPLGLLISGPWSSQELVVSLFYWIRLACYFMLPVVIFEVISSNAKNSTASLKINVDFWLKLILVTSLLVSLSGFLQLYFIPNMAQLAQYGWDPHIGRLATAMLDPNYAGVYLSCAAILGCSLMLYANSWSKRIILAVAVAVLIIAIILTFSRSAYLMLLVGLAVVSIFKARWVALAVIVVGIAVFATVPRVQQRVIGAVTIDTTASIRIASWYNSWQVAQNHPVLGVGFNSYRYAQDAAGIINQEDSGHAGAGADSSWLFLLATTGILGLLSYIVWYGRIIWIALSDTFSSQLPANQQATQLAVVAIMLALIPVSMVNNNLFYTWIMQIWLALVGVSLAIHHFRLNGQQSGSAQQAGKGNTE